MQGIFNKGKFNIFNFLRIFASEAYNGGPIPSLLGFYCIFDHVHVQPLNGHRGLINFSVLTGAGVSKLALPYSCLKFYVPELSIMHLTVSARYLISSGRGGE